MTEREQELIEKYLANTLSEAERIAFEQELAGNSELGHELERHRKSLLAIRLKGREQIRQRWSTQPGEPAPPKTSDYMRPLARMGIPVLILLLFIIFITWLWHTNSTSPGYHNGISSDTLEVQPIQHRPVPPQDSLMERPTIKPDIPSQHSKVFAAYFKPYRDETMNPTTRSATDKTPFERFQRLYWEGRYSEALTAYETLEPVLQDNDNMLFLKANLLLATGKTNESLALFEQIIRQERSRYLEEARWYRAMCYVKKGDWPAAKKQLSNIAASKGASHRKEAEQVLEQIE